jgi:ABC-type transport system involved in cytochrome bd biosynthesis fused ATPase/permease subunit
VRESIPLGDRLTVGQLMTIYRWRSIIGVAESAFDLWRIVRLLNPASALTQEMRENVTRQLYDWGRKELARRLAAAYVREVGRAAIDLYSGRLSVPAATLAMHVTKATREDRAEPELAEPLRVLIAGQVGAGKSSLVNALLRFWPLEAGTLALSGIDVERLDQHTTRGVFAVADQRAQMFAGTLRSNLTLARPDATDDELAAVLRTARLDTWVAALPDGLETPVGEGGVSISGGERRRLAVARALLAPGPVIVLDEPTSGLDERLAGEVVDGVLAAAAADGRSVLVITHRPAEAARCDVTLALEAGRVVAVSAQS